MNLKHTPLLYPLYKKNADTPCLRELYIVSCKRKCIFGYPW